jgi:GWxTD domain-containing protein
LERLALGDTTQARAALERARWELPDEPAAWAALAQLDLAENTIEGRVRARRALFRAVELAPEVATYRITLGDLLRRQRYTRAGNRMLLDAVRLDPGAGDGWRLLGQAMLESYLDQPEYEAERDSAIACYERALAANPRDLEAIETLAFLELHQHHFARARALLEPLVEADSCAHGALLLATVEFRAGEEVRAEQVLERALACLTWEQREPYLGLRAILHPDSASAWRWLGPVEREAAARAFWWSRDPSPTTLRNERLLEQVARVVEADLYFRVPVLRKPGWQTDRGEMYQRFGAPDFVERVEPRGWEWTYGQGDAWISYVFFDRYLNGDYLRLRRGAGYDYSQLEPHERHPEISRLGFGTPRAWASARHTFRGSPGRTAVDFTFVLQRDRTWASVLVEVAAWRGPGARVVHTARWLEPMQLFRLPDGRGLGRLRIEVPAEALVLAVQAAGFAGPRARVSMPASLTHSLWLASGRDSVYVENLHADALALSDVVLAHHIEPGTGGLFDHGGIIVVPRVDTRIDTDQVALYFEVYPSRAGLAARRPLALRYEVRSLPPRGFGFWDQFSAEKRARADPNRRPAVHAQFSFVPRQRVERRDLSIDVGHLEDGAYALTVQVGDPATGETASRTVEFDLDRGATVGAVTPRR